MKTFQISQLSYIIFHFMVSCAIASNPIPSTYFGMNFNQISGLANPNFYVGTSRTWDNNYNGNTVYWKDIETSSGVYSWTFLDTVITAAQARSANVIYEIGYTPAFLASVTGNWAGVPRDLTANGSPSYNAFVKALVTRYKGKITHYELWNEPNSVGYWTGTPLQLFQMIAPAYSIIKSIDPSAMVLSPPMGYVSGLQENQLLFSYGLGNFIDAVSLHCYPWTTPPAPPEFIQNMIVYNEYLLAENSLSKPIFITELADSPTANQLPASPAFLAVNYILGWPNGASSMSWYAFDNTAVGYLEGSDHGLNAAGFAYGVLENWLTGSKWTSPPARHGNANGIRNPGMLGAIIGSPGKLPTNMSVYAPDSAYGVATQILGAGPDYIDFRIYGTPTAGAAGVTWLEFEKSTQIAAAPGQSWTLGVHVALQQGSLSNLNTALGWNEYNSSGIGLTTDLPNPYITPTSLDVSKQRYWVTGPTVNANVAYVVPIIGFFYTSGQAFDQTLRIYWPTMDNGTVWQGDLIRANGKSSRIVWDANGAITSSNYKTGYSMWQDLMGQSHSVSGGSVTLTNSPIILY